MSRGGSGSLRVGLVGCGKIAHTHVPYVQKAGGRIVGIADLSPVSANELADRYCIQNIYMSVTDLLDVEKPDVVHVLTPPHTHASVAIEALERGVHVLVEKPMAHEPADVEAMRRAASRGNALLTVDHNRLFDPPVRAARKLVDSGRLGELVAVESYQAGQASPRDWLQRLKGGGLGDLIPHPLYLQLAFLGKVEKLEAFVLGSDRTQPEELRVLMGGLRRSGVLTISTRAKPQLNILRLYGTRMTVEVNLNNMTILQRREYAVPKVIGKSLPNLDEAWQLLTQTAVNTVQFLRGKVRYYPGMGLLIQRFYDAIRTGGVPPVSIDAAADVVDVTSRIWRSVRRGNERPDPMAMEA